LKQSASKLIGFYDIQRTDVTDYFKAQVSNDVTVDNIVPLAVDITHHALTTFTFWLLAATISGGTYTYAFYYITEPSAVQ
jgi:hypothetical protein